MRDRCMWCNERPVVLGSSGCSDCPTIPYKCTCQSERTGGPHNIDCERSPRFIGVRKPDPEREAIYGLPAGTRWIQSGDHSDFEPDMDDLVGAIRRMLSGLNEQSLLPRYRVISCERDPVDPTAIKIKFEWYNA